MQLLGVGMEKGRARQLPTTCVHAAHLLLCREVAQDDGALRARIENVGVPQPIAPLSEARHTHNAALHAGDANQATAGALHGWCALRSCMTVVLLCGGLMLSACGVRPAFAARQARVVAIARRALHCLRAAVDSASCAREQ